MKVLIADDDADLRALLGFALTQAGFTVHAVADGRAALSEFDHAAPDLMVLDINMPHVDGFEVCREIRRRSTLPILVLTARHDEEDLIAALDYGADDYVRKPFSTRALLARVRALARRAEPATVQSLTAGPHCHDRSPAPAPVGQGDQQRARDAQAGDLSVAPEARAARTGTRASADNAGRRLPLAGRMAPGGVLSSPRDARRRPCTSSPSTAEAHRSSSR